jgi:hypothetical protein
MSVTERTGASPHAAIEWSFADGKDLQIRATQMDCQGASKRRARQSRTSRYFRPSGLLHLTTLLEYDDSMFSSSHVTNVSITSSAPIPSQNSTSAFQALRAISLGAASAALYLYVTGLATILSGTSLTHLICTQLRPRSTQGTMLCANLGCVLTWDVYNCLKHQCGPFVILLCWLQ